MMHHFGRLYYNNKCKKIAPGESGSPLIAHLADGSEFVLRWNLNDEHEQS